MKREKPDLYLFDDALRREGVGLFCGVDEAGRGPLVGPVYAAAVILPSQPRIQGLDDSKKLSPKRREELFEEIVAAAVSYGIAWATAQEIDEVNILNATYLAMTRAIGMLDPQPELRLIDGNRAEGIPGPCRTLVGGDGKSASIAAASILAKVSRDRYMEAYARRYPGYGFEKHKGYGTKQHYEALRELGPTEEHRRSFLKKLH